jgi:hypothetical protein
MARSVYASDRRSRGPKTVNPNPVSRRRFVVAALTLAGTAAAYGPTALLNGRAWAATASGKESRYALVKIARLLYPHSALGDDVYAEVLDQAMALVADDSQFDALLVEAQVALDDLAAGSFIDASPEAQLAALQAIDQEAFWAPVQFAVANRLYSHPKAWTMMGYEGSSWQLGGWIDRGSGDIDWLPETSL